MERDAIATSKDFILKLRERLMKIYGGRKARAQEVCQKLSMVEIA